MDLLFANNSLGKLTYFTSLSISNDGNVVGILDHMDVCVWVRASVI